MCGFIVEKEHESPAILHREDARVTQLRLRDLPDSWFVVSKSEVRHNHLLIPAVFQELLFSTEMRTYICELHSISVPPRKIQMALQARGIGLATVHIRDICRLGTWPILPTCLLS
jgi:hypothetical protein